MKSYVGTAVHYWIWPIIGTWVDVAFGKFSIIFDQKKAMCLKKGFISMCFYFYYIYFWIHLFLSLNHPIIHNLQWRDFFPPIVFWMHCMTNWRTHLKAKRYVLIGSLLLYATHFLIFLHFRQHCLCHFPTTKCQTDACHCHFLQMSQLPSSTEMQPFKDKTIRKLRF